VAENFADKKYPHVSAASVLAKVHRDTEIEKLHKKYGFFGSGYSHDERTVEFLKDWMNKNNKFPDFVRKSWMTAILIKEGHEQKNMMKFLGE
jgi:ribonuclease HII